MSFKFEKLEIWRLALSYINRIYGIAEQLPKSEEFNLKSQIVRAATSVALNIAEGSTSQTDAEQTRFLGLALRSLIETVACQHIINQRNFLKDKTILRQAYIDANGLAAKIQKMRSAILPQQTWIREEDAAYSTNNGENLSTEVEIPF